MSVASDAPGGMVSRRPLVLAGALLGCCLPVVGFVAAYRLTFGAESGTGSAGIGGPFRLIDGDGRPVTERSWPGKFLLVYFGYTFCPDACPLTLSRVAAALDAMGRDADRVQPLFVTVDPARDTPGRLKAYTALFSSRIVGLTGSADAIGRVARAYGVEAIRQEEAGGGYDFDHTHSLFLMDPSGRFVAFVDPDEDPSAMARSLRGDFRI